MNSDLLLRVLDAVDAGGLHQGFIGYKSHKSDGGVVVLRWILVLRPEIRKKHRVTIANMKEAIPEGYVAKCTVDLRYVITEKGWDYYREYPNQEPL